MPIRHKSEILNSGWLKREFAKKDMHHHSSHLHHRISFYLDKFQIFPALFSWLNCHVDGQHSLQRKKMLTKVTLKEFMRILPQLEFAIKRLVNLKNHYYSSMLFGTWKKTVFKSAWCSRLLHNRCNLMAPIKKFFQLRIFSVTIFLCTDSFSHHIFKLSLSREFADYSGDTLSPCSIVHVINQLQMYTHCS